MSELNINNLPAEILTEIFRYLNEEKWKNGTIVCKLWNNLIKSAFRWILRLGLDEHGELFSKKMDLTVTRNLKFGTIAIYGGCLNGDDQKMVQIFKQHGFNVVELLLVECRIDNLTGFSKLLTFTPNLKHAHVRSRISHSSSRSSDVLLMDQLLPDLEKFKSLVFCGSDYRIFKCFRKVKLTTIEIWESEPSENRSLMVDFLSTQDKMMTLTVNPYSSSSSILVEMGKLNVPIPFQLTHLSIKDTTCEKASQDYENLVRFIKSQAGNLTEIEMRYPIPSSVLECVFANMTKLTNLSMQIDDLPWENDFYDRLKENRNVQTVRLLNTQMPDNLVDKFLQKLPNIRCLILPCFNKDTLVIAQSLSKLESLYIEQFRGTSIDVVKFPKLKTLHIHYLEGKINWNEFTKAHPLLTELTIQKMNSDSYLTSDDIDQITTNIDLQHIKLGAGFVADNRFFEIVGSKCANLKVLDLEESCISQNLTHHLKIDVLRLLDSITRLKVFRSKFLS